MKSTFCLCPARETHSLWSDLKWLYSLVVDGGGKCETGFRGGNKFLFELKHHHPPAPNKIPIHVWTRTTRTTTILRRVLNIKSINFIRQFSSSSRFEWVVARASGRSVEWDWIEWRATELGIGKQHWGWAVSTHLDSVDEPVQRRGRMRFTRWTV